MAALGRNISAFSKLCFDCTFKSHARPVLQQCFQSKPLQCNPSRYLSIGNESIRSKWSDSSKVFKIAVCSGLIYIFFSEKLWPQYKNENKVAATRYEKNKLSLISNDYLLTCIPPTPKQYATQVVSPVDKTGIKLTLYQFKSCPFCCKVRAFLDFYGFSYDVVEVNLVSKSETKWSKYKKVPFVVLDQPGNPNLYQLKDSSMFMSFLKSLLLNKRLSVEDLLQSYPIFDNLDKNDGNKKEIANRYNTIFGEVQKDATVKREMKWRKWVDDVYVHYLSVNIYRTYEESRQALQWFSQVGNWDHLFSRWQNWLILNIGPVAMYCMAKRMRKKYNTGDDVRGNFYIETNSWLKELKKLDSPFMGGGQPNLSDLSMYGVLTAIEGCATFDDLMANTNLKPWYTAMKEAVNNHQGSHLMEHYCQ